MLRMIAVCGVLFTSTACTHPPPPNWAEGGAPLVIGAAHWERGDDDSVDIDVRGQVTEGGALRYVIDRVGRIADSELKPVAVLFPAGEIIGPAAQYLGRVGVANAAPPSHDTAWVAVMPDGTVTRFGDEGERVPSGRWKGCDGAMRRTCTLVTHLILLQNYHHARPRVAIGVGVMVPY